MPVHVKRAAKKTKDEQIAHLKKLLADDIYNSGVRAFFIGLLISAIIVLSISIVNMDRKFNEVNESRNRYVRYFERQEREEYTASLCKELAEVSGRNFAISDEPNICADSKLAIQTDHQIIDAIAHFALGEKGK